MHQVPLTVMGVNVSKKNINTGDKEVGDKASWLGMLYVDAVQARHMKHMHALQASLGPASATGTILFSC